MSAPSVLPRGARNSETSLLYALVRETWLYRHECLIGIDDLAAVLREYGETDPVVLECASRLRFAFGSVGTGDDGWEAAGELRAVSDDQPGDSVCVGGDGPTARKAFEAMIADIRQVLVPPDQVA